MLGLSEQHKRVSEFAGSFTLLRLLITINMTHAAAKKQAAPYHKIVELPGKCELRR
ncbi:MAG: hypothetical protein K0S45_1760 [Nitrospira sp.]|jgi:hypothetical protein|nr:hypothetical protein [Nitrospira sp.]